MAKKRKPPGGGPNPDDNKRAKFKQYQQEWYKEKQKKIQVPQYCSSTALVLPVVPPLCYSLVLPLLPAPPPSRDGTISVTPLSLHPQLQSTRPVVVRL